MITLSVDPGEPEEIWIENDRHILGRYDQTQRDLFVDIGAHVGAVSVLAVKEDGFDMAIAVEADLENFARMIDNIAVNNCEGQIFPIWAAISTTSLERVALYMPPTVANSGCRSLL